MKYKVYSTKNTIEKYKLKKNAFNKKYAIKIFYTDSVFTEKVEMDTLEEIKEYEKYILDIMNSQIVKLVNDNELKQKELDRVLREKIARRKLFTDNVNVLVPLIVAYITNNIANLILYFPVKIIDIIYTEKYRKEIVEQIEEDMLKYYIYSSCLEDFENFSKYVTTNQKSISANNIDKYTLEQIKDYRREILELKNNEEKIKSYKYGG